MKLSILLSVVAVTYSVTAAPTSSTIPTSSAFSASSTPTPTRVSLQRPPGANTYARLILGKDNKCRVTYSINGFSGTSHPLGEYNPSTKKCSYDAQSVKKEHRQKDNKDVAYKVFYDIDSTNLLAIWFGNTFIYFPLGLTPDCGAWVRHNSNGWNTWTAWAENNQRCKYDRADWDKFMTPQPLVAWGSPFSDPQSQSQNDHSTQSVTYQPPSAQTIQEVFPPHGPSDVWAAVYRDGDQCKLWLHNVIQPGGDDRTIPAGKFDKETKRCKDTDGGVSSRTKMARANYVSLFFKDTPKWGVLVKAGVVWVRINGSIFQFPVGLRPGCRAFYQKTDGEVQYTVTPDCGIDLKEMNSVLIHARPLKIQPGASPSGK
ncbi:hypothetical protein N7492_001480 [Penicillium capsulatum]|uniref:Uncharacterized protein n=1 Tax=Penicillium capsulatum TaxID=69766 RepID=A0A9W9M0C4_9EURO|nr:hypothetical protein N7492_001480 [Penicillium capsulatum]KAJ6129466.1 hypothetical protein N7512_002246 [Penicillium capsulatum]